MQAHKFDNILQQTQPHPTQHTHAKMIYLQQQKERLQIQVNQLIQHNQLLRTINKQLTINAPTSSHSALINKMNQHNQLLQQSYLRILHQNQSLSSQLLMAQQIHEQTIAQHQTIAKDYEQKIIQLRRSIQVKQSSIQQLQKKLKCDDSIITAPTNVTLLFFNEIDQLKKDIEGLTNRNRQMQRENKQYKKRADKLEKKLLLIQTLITKSKLMYEQFKMYYQQESQKRRQSAPKKDTCLPFTHHQPTNNNKKLNQAQTTLQTRQYTDYPIKMDSSIKMLVYKQALQIIDLRDKYKQITHKLKAEQQLKQKITASNSQLSHKLSTITAQLNYYKKSTQQLMHALSSKTNRTNSCQKIHKQHLISTIKQPVQVSYMSQRKKHWVDVQQSIKVDRFKLLHIKNKYKQTKRSLSCFMDYHRREENNTQKYINRKGALTSNKKLNRIDRIGQGQLYGSNDFSLFIQQLEGDISIIQSSAQKPKHKTSYSDWKKNKHAVNLTILEQNIL